MLRIGINLLWFIFQFFFYLNWFFRLLLELDLLMIVERKIVVLNLVSVFRELKRFLLSLDLDKVKRFRHIGLIGGVRLIPKVLHISEDG